MVEWAEVFKQLLKQSRPNPEERVLWGRELSPLFELFVVMATVADTGQAQKDVLDGLWLFLGHPVVGDYATLAAMRVDQRCRPPCRPVGEPTVDLLRWMLRGVSAASCPFGAPLCEQLWRQRETHPKLRIPVPVLCLVQQLVRQGCERRDRLFRHEANGIAVQQVMEAFGEGQDVSANAGVDVLAAVLVLWFRALPDGIPSTAGGSAAAIVGHCTKQYSVVLRFLVGFLQSIARKLEEVGTDNTAGELAAVFGPELVRAEGGAAVTASMRERGVALLEELLTSLFTADVYPPRGVLNSGRGVTDGAYVIHRGVAP